MVNTNLIGDIKIEGYEDLFKSKNWKVKLHFCDPANLPSAYEHLINMLYAMGKGDPEKAGITVKPFALI